MRFLKMGMFVAFVLLGLVGFLSMLSLKSVPAQHGPVATGNGDTNGDGSLDIADAIYLLVHLFRDGPPPVAVADSPELLARVAGVEERLVALEETISVVAERVEEVREEALATSKKFALLFVGQQPSLLYIAECAERTGPATFEPGASVVGGTVSEDGITFETNRRAMLLVEIDYHVEGETIGRFELLLDGTAFVFHFSRGSRSVRLIVPDVPGGSHSLTAIGIGGCRVGGFDERIAGSMTISRLLVSYLD